MTYEVRRELLAKITCQYYDEVLQEVVFDFEWRGESDDPFPFNTNSSFFFLIIVITRQGSVGVSPLQ
jgi:hypothetical protein